MAWLDRFRSPTTQELTPRLLAASFLDIDFAQVGEGLFLILDIDNTIALRHAPEPVPGVRERLASLRGSGTLRDVALVSNVGLTGLYGSRVARMADFLGAHPVAVGFAHLKPSPRPFLRAMELMGADRGLTVVVGDQLYTDILGGNRLGLFTIRVEPLGADHFLTRLLGRRVREQRILRGIVSR